MYLIPTNINNSKYCPTFSANLQTICKQWFTTICNENLCPYIYLKWRFPKLQVLFFTPFPAPPVVSTKAACQIPLWATNFDFSTYINFSRLLPTPLCILPTSKDSEDFHMSQLSSPHNYRIWSWCIAVITSY